MLKKIFLFLTVICLFSIFLQISFAQKKKKSIKKTLPKTNGTVSVGLVKDEPIPKNLTPAQKIRVETFNEVWNTINENYFDLKFNGVDWNKIRAEFTPKVIKLKTDQELHLLLQEMINRLNRSHFFIILPEAYQEIERVKEESRQREAEKISTADKENSEENTVDKDEETVDKSEIFYQFGLPIDIRIIDTEVVITNIKKDSNVEKAGLKQGYILDKINGVSLKDLITRLQNYNAYSKTLKNQLPAIILSIMEGEEDSEIEITYLDEDNKPHTVTIIREGLSGELVSVIENVPAQLLDFQKKSLDEKTGYIKFNVFALPVLFKFCETLQEFKGKEALVIDLRGNIGGAFGVLFGITGLLNDKYTKIGTEINRYNQSPLGVFPTPRNFKGKIAILVDGHSVSAAEIFAASMKENGRAVVFGEKTAGEALPALPKNLQTGAVLLYPIANLKTPNGNFLEGKGVEPDFSVLYDRKTLLQGKDKQLDDAFNYLKNKQITPETKKNIVVVSDSDEPPPVKPTPKPITNIAKIGNNPPPIFKVEVENKQDEKALAIVDESVKVLGGEASLRKITSINATGIVELNRAGTIVNGLVEYNRKAPNKIAEILFFEGTGQIREVFDGKNYLVQSLSNGINQQNLPSFTNDFGLWADFYEIVNFRELYPNVKLTGVFEREGKKINLIEATSKNGVKVAFAFDLETKFLISRASNYSVVSFENYQKVDDLMFPFTQTRSIIFKYKLTDVKFNTQIDDAKFVKEENCFTKID